MTYWPTTQIAFANTPAVDSFGRMRVSNPDTLFDYGSQYNGALFWDTVSNLGGGITYPANISLVKLSTNSNVVGASVARQTFEYFRYQPGKSQLIVFTGIIGAPKTDVRQRAGYFDTQNGLFFEQDITNLKVVLRSFTSGVVVDTAINQSDWNTDKLDGTGPSGMNLDTSKNNIYFINFQYLGAGDVMFGVYTPDGVPIICHKIENANQLTVPYMTTGNLPLRYEIENTGSGSGGSTDLFQGCGTVISEGGAQFERAYQFAVSSGITTINVTTRRIILAIRPKLLFNGVTNRVKVIPTEYEAQAGGNPAYCEIVYNPTLVSAATWADVNTHSCMEYSVDANTFTDGIVIDAFFIPQTGGGSNRGVISQNNTSKYPITLDALATSSKILAIVATSFTATSTDSGAFTWQEIR